jgi:hypothetical protein
MVARTDVDGYVVQLKPVGPDNDGHGQIVDTIAELFNTEINIEDFSDFGSAIPWAPKFESSEKSWESPAIGQADINSASSDRLNLLGIPLHPASLIRLAGATFLILGIVLIRT